MFPFLGAVLLAAAPSPVVLDRTEVTVADYARCVAAGACTSTGLDRSDWGPPALCNHGRPGRALHPANCVDLAQAAAACAFLGKRLPTDAEWEQALGPATFPWGEAAPDETRLCLRRGEEDGTCPVGRFPAGATDAGLLDLAGNVAEWTSTPAEGDGRVIHRGGSFSGGWLEATTARFGHLRGVDLASLRGSLLGFRCANGAGTGLAPSSPPATSAPVVRVDAWVVTRPDGSGNSQWTARWLQRVLARATQLQHGEVRYLPGRVEQVRDEVLFSLGSQLSAVDWVRPRARRGRVTVVFTRPDLDTTAGYSQPESLHRHLRPHLALRSGRGDGSDADVYERAVLFLHELGHTAGFSHTGEATRPPWPTDGWWDVPAARERMRLLARWLELHANGAAPVPTGAFRCGPGPAPTGGALLLEPATDAASAAECARRCLLLAGCEATTRPTWDDAPCSLHGAGVRAGEGAPRGSLEVCWRVP